MANKKYYKGGWLDKYTPTAENGIEGTMGGLTDKGFNYNGAWGGQFDIGGQVTKAQRGFSCPKNICDSSYSGQQGGVGRLIGGIGDFLGVGKGDERKERRAERRAERLLKRGEKKKNEIDDNSEDVNTNSGGLFGGNMIPPSFENDFNNFDYFQNKLSIPGFGRTTAMGGFFRNTIPTTSPEQNATPIYGDSIVSNYTSPEANVSENLLNQGKLYDGVPGGISSESVLTAMNGASLPGSVGFMYARTNSPAPSEGPYAKKTLPSAQNGQEMRYYQEGLDWKPKTISKKGSVIKDDRGQWAHPGKITEIGSNQITMQGVPYPVLGVSDTGDTQLMYPGEDYQYDGSSVTEFPMMQKGGTKKGSYEPSQTLNNTKAILAAIDASTGFSSNPYARGINFLTRAANSAADAYTAARYAMDGQGTNAAVDAGEALIDLIPYRKGNRVINLSKTNNLPGTYNKMSKLDKSINRGLKVGKVAAGADDFMNSSLGKFLFGNPNLIQNEYGGLIKAQSGLEYMNLGPTGSTNKEVRRSCGRSSYDAGMNAEAARELRKLAKEKGPEQLTEWQDITRLDKEDKKDLKEQFKLIKDKYPGLDFNMLVAANRDAGRTSVQFSQPERYGQYFNPETGEFLKNTDTRNVDNYTRFYRRQFPKQTKISATDVLDVYNKMPGGVSNYQRYVDEGYFPLDQAPPNQRYGGLTKLQTKMVNQKASQSWLDQYK